MYRRDHNYGNSKRNSIDIIADLLKDRKQWMLLPREIGSISIV